MSARVGTLVDVGPRGGRYVFLVEWNDYADRVRDELNHQADAFGLDLGPGAWYVRAFPQRMFEIAQQVIAKPWPADIAVRFDTDQEPIIVIFDRDWSEFDPREHPYAIIWLSDFSDDPHAVRPLLQQLAWRVRQGDDVVAHLRDVAERERRRALVDGADRVTGAWPGSPATSRSSQGSLVSPST